LQDDNLLIKRATEVIGSFWSQVNVHVQDVAKSIPLWFFAVFLSSRLEFKSEILKTYLVILYAQNSLTAFKQLATIQSYQLTVMSPSDLSVLENVQSKAKL